MFTRGRAPRRRDVVLRDRRRRGPRALEGGGRGARRRLRLADVDSGGPATGRRRLREVPVPHVGRPRDRGRAHSVARSRGGACLESAPARRRSGVDGGAPDGEVHGLPQLAGRLRAGLRLLRDGAPGRHPQPQDLGDPGAAPTDRRGGRAPRAWGRLHGDGGAAAQLRERDPRGADHVGSGGAGDRRQGDLDLDRRRAAGDPQVHRRGAPLPADPVAGGAHLRGAPAAHADREPVAAGRGDGGDARARGGERPAGDAGLRRDRRRRTPRRTTPGPWARWSPARG